MSEGWDKETVKSAVEQAVTTGLLPKPKAKKYQLLLSDKGKLGNGVPTKIRHFLDELKDKIKQDQEERARGWRDESIRLQESLDSTPIELTLTEWLRSGAAPAGFVLQEEAELKAVLEQGGILRSKHQDLVSDEIRGHIAAGKLVTKLALEWRERISFMLSDDGSLKRVKYSTTLLEQNDDIDREDYAQRFDADFILMTGELAALIADLVMALGGEATSSSWVDLDGAERDDDDRYPEAVEFIKAKGKASISGLQRELRIGYNRAAWLLERMQVEGIVSQPTLDGTRQVLVGEGA
ncbi:recombination associated protein [Yersinia aldovae]|uniref:Recombination-associated protein RdgC n=1 Tax=Yersinia aldovae TaxID=29483 RepID=A0ABM9STZ4_YERAL|nr:recombination associated protein [Yersinia aldovae]